jgi:hypothetical protein
LGVGDAAAATSTSKGGLGIRTIWSSAALASFTLPLEILTVSTWINSARSMCASANITPQIAATTIGMVSRNDHRSGLTSDNERAPTNACVSKDKVRIVRERGWRQQYQCKAITIEIG